MSVVQGAHLVAGQWIDIDPTAAPDAGQAATPRVLALVADACCAAEDAFVAYGQTTRACRADFLEAIAHALDTRADAITSIAGHETALPAARLHEELGRTTGQIRMFARHIRDGAYLDRRHDPARPDRTPLPRPDLRLI